MGRVRIVKNDLPKIIREIPLAVGRQLGDTADELKETIIAGSLSDRVEGDTEVRQPRLMHAEVRVGENDAAGARSFFASMIEFGTANNGAVPFFWPAVHDAEVTFPAQVGDAVRKACS